MQTAICCDTPPEHLKGFPLSRVAPEATSSLLIQCDALQHTCPKGLPIKKNDPALSKKRGESTALEAGGEKGQAKLSGLLLLTS